MNRETERRIVDKGGGAKEIEREGERDEKRREEKRREEKRREEKREDSDGVCDAKRERIKGTGKVKSTYDRQKQR
jgi:hypothetical protein